ncbi:odorant receptor Or1-like [Fopius arisanus]|uniref:Odorant receptor n=1 Tax=Fopius arisanus TaxID=64838 RepID=A0A9R1U1U9_9HYME|nr:PREDICTED: odorant receptor Or1-like [Fopius arisanus]
MLPYSFTILQILGFCRSVNWQKGWKTTLYDCYTYTMLFLLYTNAVFQSIYVFSSIESVDALIDNTFILLTTISSGFKATRFVMRREEIIRLLRIYRNHPCAPQDQAEEFIQSKYHRVIHNLSLCYISFTMATVTFQTSAQWRLAIPQRELIYKSWLPYDNSHPLAFWLSHVHQMICQFADASVSCTYGVIVAAMMINISGQFVILSHRLENLRESVGYQDKEGITKIRDHGTHDEIVDMERKKLAECIQHHLHIFDCFERSNDVFSGTMLGQYMASAFILCGTIYKVSKMTGLDPELIGIVMYLTCMLFDIFLPCYFGHEVTTESFRVSHGVYNMDWSELKIPTQKSLILIMNRSLKPLTFTSGYIVQLSLDSFGGLIKTSYSIFNLLKQQSN